MPIIVAGAVALGALGFAANQTGEAVEKTGDTAIKLAIAGAAIYFIGKKMKVIK